MTSGSEANTCTWVNTYIAGKRACHALASEPSRFWAPDMAARHCDCGGGHKKLSRGVGLAYGFVNTETYPFGPCPGR